MKNNCIFVEKNMKQSFSNFNINKNNILAYALIKEISVNPKIIASPILIVGKNGVGKTHLMIALENEVKDKTNVIRISSEQFLEETKQVVRTKNINGIYGKYEKTDILIIENIEFLIKYYKKTIDILHDLIKKLTVENSKIVLLTVGMDLKKVKNIKVIEELKLNDFEDLLIVDVK